MTFTLIFYIIGAIIGLGAFYYMVYGSFFNDGGGIVSYPDNERHSLDELKQLSYQSPIIIFGNRFETASTYKDFSKTTWPSIDSIIEDKGYLVFLAYVGGPVNRTPFTRFLLENNARVREAVFLIKNGNLVGTKKMDWNIQGGRAKYIKEKRAEVSNAIDEFLGEIVIVKEQTTVTPIIAPEYIRCPECGSEMGTRTVKKGPNAGRQFHVCTLYPACKGKIEVE